MEVSTPPKLLTERECALYLTVSRAYLSATRVRHLGGPPFIRFGRTIRYLTSDLDSWIEKNRVIYDRQPEALESVVKGEGDT